MMIIVREKILFLVLELIILALLPFTAGAQSNAEKKKIFAEAESSFLFEEYELANPLYLLLDNRDNNNIKYKIGVCYLNIPGEKNKAIPYLESAVEDATYEAKTGRFSEKRAPLDAFFFLGKAYMINNELEKALRTFQNFKNLAEGTEDKGGMKNLEYIDQLIESCNNAMSAQEDPFRVSKNLLGKNFSQGSLNENPAVSFDGNTIVYTERRGIINAIMFSKKIRDEWQKPIEITEQMKAGDDCSSSSLNYDGTLLFLYKTDNFDGNIYSSEYINDTWSPIKKLNNNINTKFYESHASVSADGMRLYFTSNREGGKGGLDIYMSERDQSGDWGIPVNLGNNINTPFNEDTPFITLNDSLLYFSSEGHNGLGGYDIFRSKGTGSVWELPENMGFPINSTDDDRFFQPFNNDEAGYYSLPTEYKKKDIFYLTLTNTRLGRIFELSGNYRLRDTVVQFDKTNSIYLIDRASGDTLETGYPDMYSGKYSFIVSPGNFRLVYTGQGYYSQHTDTAILADNPSKLISLADIVLDKITGGDASAYEKIDLSKIPVVTEIDSGILIRDLMVSDVTDNDSNDSSILYYTVQVMALYNPVDISYFRHVSDIKVFYNASDFFYRYTTGIFDDKNDAYAHREELFRLGYPDDLFIKKVTRISDDNPVPSRKYYSIQLKATTIRVNIRTTFPGLTGISEREEIDGMYHYLYGQYTSAAEAEEAMKRPEISKFEDAFVREINVLIRK
jgi:hypothetical protein